jgi:hypothetical protein
MPTAGSGGESPHILVPARTPTFSGSNPPPDQLISGRWSAKVHCKELSNTLYIVSHTCLFILGK